MARKILIVVALVTLVAAAPGLAETLDFGPYLEGCSWSEVFGSGGPGSANGSFSGYVGNLSISRLVNPDPIGTTSPNQIVYQTRDSAAPDLIYQVGDVPVITSFDTVITVTEVRNGLALQDGTMFLSGTGKNTDDLPFSFTGTLTSTAPDFYLSVMGKDAGIFTALTLDYTPPADSASAPIPGAVWLLGTGLLGLACAGRRRRS